MRRFIHCSRTYVRLREKIYSSRINTADIFNGNYRRLKYRVEDRRVRDETPDRFTKSPLGRLETVNTIQSGMDCRERRLCMKVNINVVSLAYTYSVAGSPVCDREYQHERASLVNSTSRGCTSRLMRAWTRGIGECHLFSIKRGICAYISVRDFYDARLR